MLDIAETVKQTKKENEMMVAFNNTIYIVTQEALMNKTLKEMSKTKVHIREQGRVSNADCDIDETKDRKLKPYKAHSCINSEECKGERQCTAFGWCRGKAMCNEYSKQAACLIFESQDMTCLGDYDCRGARFCGDFGYCEGQD